MKEELYEEIMEVLLEHLGYKCQPGDLEDLANLIIDTLRSNLSEELR